MKAFLGLTLALAATALAAGARSQEPALAGSPAACVEAMIAAGQPVAQCVNQSQAACLQHSQATALAATACFLQARDEWAALITDRLEAIGAVADDDVSGVAGIEVKYDLLANFLQCDRLHELSLLTEAEGVQLDWQKSRCQSTAAGLVFVKLVLQSHEILAEPGGAPQQ